MPILQLGFILLLGALSCLTFFDNWAGDKGLWGTRPKVSRCLVVFLFGAKPSGNKGVRASATQPTDPKAQSLNPKA